MKASRKQESGQNKQGHNNIPKPDIRDNMDSRKEKEDSYRGYNNATSKKKRIKDKNKAGN